MSLLTKEEISELIKQKEERDKVFEHEEQERAKETEVIYHKIKDLFLKYVIEESILRGYKVDHHTYNRCIVRSIAETTELDFDIDVWFGWDSKTYLSKYFDEKREDFSKCAKFQLSYNSLLLNKNLTKLLLLNGFEEDRFGYLSFKTSKKALLGESKIPECVAPPTAEINDIGVETKEIGLVAFVGLLIAVGIMCWLKSIY